ncbi:hypothetical protein TrCOL_g13711 [Triparma columacea]|uniref:RING-type domain-containing protein n=1 Tax=Triparma columacea TaxID=722753 RepID=A0A9W7LCA5_9STRA|nr:hypothetical protein TrCOL_g13711 [Triparma columacea]
MAMSQSIVGATRGLVALGAHHQGLEMTGSSEEDEEDLGSRQTHRTGPIAPQPPLADASLTDRRNLTFNVLRNTPPVVPSSVNCGPINESNPPDLHEEAVEVEVEEVDEDGNSYSCLTIISSPDRSLSSSRESFDSSSLSISPSSIFNQPPTPPPELPLCAVCMDVLVGATTTSCGHEGCYSCLRELQKVHERGKNFVDRVTYLFDDTIFKCPECREDVKDIKMGRKFDNLIEDSISRQGDEDLYESYISRVKEHYQYVREEREESEKAEEVITNTMKIAGVGAGAAVLFGGVYSMVKKKNRAES